MKKQNFIALILLAFTAVLMPSCETVRPNFVGVLMQNWGKNGKQDFTQVKGRVTTIAPGVELYQVPLYEQRADFGERVLALKAADNTEFNARPVYSYEVIEDKAIDVVFRNASRVKESGGGSNGREFMEALEDHVLEPHIYDIVKEEAKTYLTDSLMADGGNLRFEQSLQNILVKKFQEKGLRLLTFQPNLDFSDKVKDRIDNRNEVSTNLSVLDQQVNEQRKKNELAKLQQEYNLILSQGITEELLKQKAIDGWVKAGCPMPQVINSSGGASNGSFIYTVSGAKK
jgi:hypothetical protein